MDKEIPFLPNFRSGFWEINKIELFDIEKFSVKIPGEIRDLTRAVLWMQKR